MKPKCKKRNCKEKYHAKGLCQNHYNKYRRTLDPDKDWRYEKTFNGFLMRLYRNMLQRVDGSHPDRPNYIGKKILSKEAFYAWAKPHPTYAKLFNTYTTNGYPRRLAPSVDRVNPDKGYTLDNMEWVTHAENSRRGNVTKRRLKK